MKRPLDRGGLRFYLVLIALVRGAATPRTIAAGVPLLLLGAALHLWAKGCLRQNRSVTRIGPYRFVRHPFYLANALIDAGIAVMSGWWVLQAVLPAWWLTVYLPVMRSEEDYLTRVFGSVHEDYRRRIPRLVPWRRPLPRTVEGFCWNNPNLTVDGAASRALRLLAYPLLLLLCGRLRASGAALPADPIMLAALVGLAAIYALAWATKARKVFSVQ
ncbi:MAG: isoprenylcysteine carboxylmethyltransferase family protein [Thermoguttaceae bacterium]|jgi:hypothetical protein